MINFNEPTTYGTIVNISRLGELSRSVSQKYRRDFWDVYARGGSYQLYPDS